VVPGLSGRPPLGTRGPCVLGRETALAPVTWTPDDGDEIRSLGFTGAFVGLWVWDLNGHGHHADFDRATYGSEPSRAS